MIVLGIDPGRLSGWCLSHPRLSGSVDHQHTAMSLWWAARAPRGMAGAWTKTLPKEERLKRVLGAYSDWLEQLIWYHAPAVVVIERMKPFRGRASTNTLEFRGASMAVAGRLDVALVECAPEKWQQLLAGRAYDPAKDHHVAAELMVEWFVAQQQGLAA